MSYKALGKWVEKKKKKKTPRLVSIKRDWRSIKTFVYERTSARFITMARDISWWISLFLPQNTVYK